MPNLQRLGAVRVGETVPEKLRLALDLEREAIERLNRGIGSASTPATTEVASCSRTSSRARRTHADWLETQLELIAQVGEAHYLAQQMHD